MGLARERGADRIDLNTSVADEAARALYASVEIDEEIPVEHFEAVAKVISFIMNGKKPQGRSEARARPL